MNTTETYVFDNGGATADRYTVLINLPDEQGRPDFNMWTMSEDALMPNGCCIYIGTITESEVSDYFKDVLSGDIIRVQLATWPKQVKTQIERIIASS